MSVNDESERLLRAAMGRILAGKPIRSSGSHTVTALAAEAGVSRRTASRATAVLRDFREAFDPLRVQQTRAPNEFMIADELADVRAKLGRRNSEVIALRAELRALACRVALLGAENAVLRADLRRGRLVVLPTGAAGDEDRARGSPEDPEIAAPLNSAVRAIE